MIRAPRKGSERSNEKVSQLTPFTNTIIATVDMNVPLSEGEECSDEVPMSECQDIEGKEVEGAKRYESARKFFSVL